MLQSQATCLISRVDQPLTSRATKLLDKNRLCSSAISCSVAELWSIVWVCVPLNFSYAV